MFGTFFSNVRGWKSFIYPKSDNEDDFRIELILNVLLVASIFLIFTGLIIQIVVRTLGLVGQEVLANSGISLLITFTVFSLFLFLYYLSRKGFFNFASYLLLSIFFSLILFMNYRWGVDLPSTILLDALLIVMSGILISTRFAFATTAVVVILMISIDSMHKSGIIEVNRYWRSEAWRVNRHFGGAKKLVLWHTTAKILTKTTYAM